MASEQFYIQPEIGITFASGSGTGSAFTYAIGGGYMLSENLSAGLRYEAQSASGGSNGFLGGRFAYHF